MRARESAKMVLVAGLDRPARSGAAVGQAPSRGKRKKAAERAAGKRRPRWRDWPAERLLELRLCDLGLAVEGSWLDELTEQVQEELDSRGLRIRPHYWLSDEWFSPGGIPGVAIPFYLAHPRLIRLERSKMLEVEGGTRDECLRLIRHEVGHAVQHGYALHRRRRWQGVFGKSSTPYPESYRPNPASKRYVQHLGAWYAQSHPDEDFAETFAVWLRPRSDWRRRYARWPALKKLEYVDELMSDVAGRRPIVNKRTTPYSLKTMRKTVRQHYEEKHDRYSVSYSVTFDRDLLKVFSAQSKHRDRETAASFLRRHRTEIRKLVSRWTGEYEFTLDQVLREMIGRCRELKLRVVGTERRLKLDFAILLTVHTMHYLFRGRYWRAL